MSVKKPSLAELREALPTSTAPDEILTSPFFHLGRLQEAVKDEPSLVLATELIMASLMDGARAVDRIEQVRFAVRDSIA